MKYLLIVIACFSIFGCVSPRTLAPVAIKNQENVKNYIHNNERIYPILEKLVVLRLEIELSKIRKQVEDDIIRGYSDPLDPAKLMSEAQKIKDVLEVINSLSTQVDENSRSQLNSKNNELEIMKQTHPIAYDVATGKFKKETIVQDNKRVDDTYLLYRDQDTQLSIVNPLLDKYTMVAEFIKTKQAIINAFDIYISNLHEQGKIAIRHAEAVVFYTKENYDAGDTILQTIGDVEIQKGVLEIISDTSGEERSNKAKEILEAISLPKEEN